MVFELVNFYPASYEGKTIEEFVKHESHVGLSEKKLKEIYRLLNPKKKEQAAKPASSLTNGNDTISPKKS
jgi:hypothetical protein